MVTKLEVRLNDLQKTLFMPVWARAMETLKQKPLLRDNAALKVMESVDFDFSNMTRNVTEISQLSWIARCIRYDRVINNFISKNPDAVIVNIGCGLDTNYERINNDTIEWFDLDLPEVIDLRKKLIPAEGKRKYIGGSFFETGWMDLVPKKKVLFISAGVFVYFDEARIESFIRTLANTFPGSELLFDVTSPRGLKIANNVISKSGLNSNSFFRWGLKNGSEFINRNQHLRLIDKYYTFKIEGLGLSFKNKIIGFISDFLKIQYMLHIGIK